MHILNLVIKSVLHQFEAPKAKGDKVTNNAAREQAAVFDELDNNQETSGGNEGGVETNDDGEDENAVGEDENAVGEDENAVGDNNDGLPYEQDEMSDEELIRLQESVKPI